ncbi:MAG: Hsp20 family protein [Gammaproteobacteria bacterium]|nr:Hsp20 family protein [Gammaproteobacteria bacterium]NND39137.1 Hsp20 family protein [Pseudomonadales bacterium]MBT8150254.1 Hsp20 family protein [Gammaproteobacteria bacterium]NNL10834.1 Hsp20 family protein [Pseudomonadales bacterium]NNM11626.1 Hsp20 family protein [Pseudomonadales bacterium]
MKSIDLTPLYRDSVGFDHLASLLDTALRSDTIAPGYPPYNIELLDEKSYAITLALAGFDKRDLSISVENGVLTVRGEGADGDSTDNDSNREYLHRGIATRAFERRFNLADYVEVTDARFENGLLTIELVKEIPEAMKPKTIAITDGDGAQRKDRTIEHQADNTGDQAEEAAA